MNPKNMMTFNYGVMKMLKKIIVEMSVKGISDKELDNLIENDCYYRGVKIVLIK